MTRGGFGSKVHLMTDARGLPIGCVLTQGNRNECPVFDELLDAALAGAAGAGGALPARLAADRAYNAAAIRTRLAALGVEAVIPPRSSDRPIPYDRTAYRGRNVIERCVGRLKEMRRIGTRYEKLASSYLAMLTLGMAVLYLRALT
jgi:transposase